MNCRYCGKKLGFGRRLASRQFCSSEHQQCFEREYQQVLLNRLDVVVAKEAAGVGAPSQPAAPPLAGFRRKESWNPIFRRESPLPTAQPGFPAIGPAVPEFALWVPPPGPNVCGWFDPLGAALPPEPAEHFQVECIARPFLLTPALSWSAQVIPWSQLPCSCPAESLPAGLALPSASGTGREPLAPARSLRSMTRPLAALLRVPNLNTVPLARAGRADARFGAPLAPPAAATDIPAVLAPQASPALPALSLRMISSPALAGLLPDVPECPFTEADLKPVQAAIRLESARPGVAFSPRELQLPRIPEPMLVRRIPQAGCAALRLETIRDRPRWEPVRFGVVAFPAPELRLDCALPLSSPPLSSLAAPVTPPARPSRRKALPSTKAGVARTLVPVERPPRMGRVALAAPLVVALVYFCSRPDAGRIVQAQWNETRQQIHSRAFVELEENFPRDVASWRQGTNTARWLNDKPGFVRHADLALYSPSRRLTDYRLDFSAVIERKGIGWVFRAEDVQNYYAMKIVLLSARPPYAAALLRYAVVEGEQDPEVQAPATLYIMPNTPFPVRVDVRGGQFVASVHGREVDSWSDGRLRTGGVGFFSDKWARNRLLWMRVSNQDDFLGKLCAVIAPHLPQTLNWRRIP